MSVPADERAVSTLVGAVFVFAFAFLLLALWQSQVVPQQNGEIEFNHNLNVQDDLVDARNAIVSAATGGEVPAISIDMAPSYPARTVFINPAPPQAALRTVGTDDSTVAVTLDNATVTDDEVADFWTGTTRSYNTGLLAYEPGYNVYTEAPTTIYGNTRLYNRHGRGVNITLAEQALVDGETVTLIALNGSLSRNQAQTYSLDLERLSTSSRTVAVTNASDGPVTVTFPSRLNASQWNASFAETGELSSQGGHVVDVRSAGQAGGFTVIAVELEAGVTYTLRMAKVGVGQATTAPGPAYVIDVRGDGRTVSTAGSQALVVEVRDRFNNPVAGVTVRNHTTTDLNGGTLDAETKVTDDDGRVTFEFTPGLAGTATISFNISDGGSPTAEEVVNFTVTVTGGDARPPSLSEFVADSTATTCPGTADCYGTVTFDYGVADDTQVAELTVRLLTKDGAEVASQTESIGASSATGTVSFDVSAEQIPVSDDLAYEVVVADAAGNTETDTGLVPGP